MSSVALKNKGICKSQFIKKKIFFFFEATGMEALMNLGKICPGKAESENEDS